ncbi:MAG TPA: hypothetical protein VMW38_18455 [Terriglobia bacterium]|nr:hypothetical protein [Terriglobia bacterium]
MILFKLTRTDENAFDSSFEGGGGCLGTTGGADMPNVGMSAPAHGSLD